MNKRLFLFISLVLSVLSSAAFAENVSVQTAQTAAQSFLNFKMEGNPQIHLIDFAEKDEFPNFYVFGNEHCFVIIAGDDCVHPVLGYSTDHSIDCEPMPEAVYDWLNAYNLAISAIMESQNEVLPEIQAQWETLLNGRGLEPKLRSHVEPLVRTRWQYATPFNNLCPADTAGPGGHAKAGCGAVAMSQLMNYWEHPVRGNGSFSYTPTNHPEYGVQYVNFGETIYDWDHMRNVYQKTYSSEEALAVATLVYHCGVSVRMNYGPDESGTSTSRIDDALINYFDYNGSMAYREKSDYTDTQWIAMLKSDLDNERPIIYRGTAANSDGGHIFICDGYDENNYFHFNWGYAGRWDGYFALGALFGGADYSYGNTAIFGIYPNSTSINPPSNISTSVEGRTVTISWNSVNNASSYKIYRDNDLIESGVTSTSYTNTNVPYGEHSYYVKSVKSDGTMSLKSNTSVAEVSFSGPVPTNLQASTNNHNVNLSWNDPQSESAVLQYGTENPVAGVGGAGNGFYWAHRFPAETVSNYAGMAVQKVSFYFRKTGTYTVSIYTGDEANPKELVYQQQYQASSINCWKDIVFNNLVPIDYTKDLWVVFFADSSVSHPASFCTYSGLGIIDAALYSSVDGGTIWKEYVYTDTNHVSHTCSWLMKTYITDGTYTYNLYRNGDAVATNLSNNTYTDGNLPDGFYDYHVTTNYFGGESDPSNTASVMVGNPSYTVSVSANPSSGGSVTGGGSYSHGQTCTVTAAPNTGYTFLNWTENGNVVSTNASYSFTVTEAHNLVAHFNLMSYTVSVSANPTSGGSVTGGGSYNHGQTCTVTATPNNGYTFLNWTENGNVVSTNASYSFTVTGDRNLVAHFQLDNYVISLSAEPSNGGMVTGGGAFHYGDNCTVVATANPGFHFVNWTEDGTQISENAAYSFVVTGDRSIVAHFTSLNYVITASADPIEGGTVTGAGGYSYGDQCTLTATANPGFDFQNWTRNGTVVSTSLTYSFTVTESASYVAHFTAQTYTITVSANPTAGGTVSGGGTFTHGQTCTVHATANSCYTFDNWTENGQVVSNQPDYSFVVTSDRNLVANFMRDAYEITAEVNPIGGGVVMGAGVYQCGEMVTLTAEPNENYSFLNWTENGNQVTDNLTVQFVVTDPHHLEANFIYYDGMEENASSVDVYPNPANDILIIKGKNILKVTVYNMRGQVIEDREAEGKEMVQFRIQSFSPGSYLLKIMTGGVTITKSFIKE